MYKKIFIFYAMMFYVQIARNFDQMKWLDYLYFGKHQLFFAPQSKSQSQFASIRKTPPWIKVNWNFTLIKVINN